MDKLWLGIRVDLLGGRGEILQPPPGRSFAVPPSCTFEEFGQTIDQAFARWDLSHLRQFELEDGTLVVDEEMADELRASPFGGSAIPRILLLDAKVGRNLKVGTRFRYVFDLRVHLVEDSREGWRNIADFAVAGEDPLTEQLVA
jgi:hypothetical protein